MKTDDNEINQCGGSKQKKKTRTKKCKLSEKGYCTIFVDYQELTPIKCKGWARKCWNFFYNHYYDLQTGKK